jgi:trimeric autotransporter adhesin
MSNKSSIFTVFSVLVGVMLFGVWSNIYAYAQQSSSSQSSTPTGSSVSKPISQELKAKMCDPSNPSLKVVNTTEARICGIPKTVKPALASAAATPKTSTVSSSPSTAANITAPKQQQIKAVNNTHINAISRPARGATGTTIAPVSHSHPTNTSLSSSSSPLAIAPQIRAINQQQPSPSIRGINSTTGFNSTTSTAAINTTALPPIILINGTTPINSTAGQNYTFAATSPVATSDQLLYLGYHGPQGNSGSKHNDNHDSKPHTRSSTRSVSDGSSEHKETKPSTPPRIKIIATDNDSTAKKTTSSTKVDRTDSANDDPKPPKPRSTKTTNDNSLTAKKTTSSTNDDGSSKDKTSPNTESSSDHVVDSGSSLKKKKTKSDNDGSSKHSDDSTDTKPSLHRSTKNTDDSSPKDKSKFDPKPHTARTSPNDDSSDATSLSRNEDSKSSIIENDIPSVIVKSFNSKHSTDSDSSKSSSIDNDTPSVIVKSFNSKHSTDSDSSDKGGDSFFDGDKFFSDDGDGGF